MAGSRKNPNRPQFNWANVALLVVVILTVYAAFSSQRASNDIAKTQGDITMITSCNQQYLSKTIKALNERTTYSQESTRANVELQRSQAEYLRVVLIDPPAPPEKIREALQKYFSALTDFVDVSGKTSRKVAEFSYPTNEELIKCLNP